VANKLSFAPRLSALAQKAELAKKVDELVNAKFAIARAAREEQREVALALHEALAQHLGLPWGEGDLRSLPSTPPAAPHFAALWREAKEAKASLVREAEAAFNEAAQRGNAALDEVMAISAAYAPQVGLLRPYGRIWEAMPKEEASPKPARQAAHAAAAKAQAKPAPKAKVRGKTKRADAPARKATKKRRRQPASSTFQRAKSALETAGFLFFKTPKGDWQLTHPDRVVRLRLGDAQIVAAAKAAQKAAQSGGDIIAAVVTAAL